MNVKGYKVFNPDWTCSGFQYEVGKTYKHDGNIEAHEEGFHFCQKVSDCFNYYTFDGRNKVAEVKAVGTVKTIGDKSVTDMIEIVREITWSEVLTLSNSGDCNSGDWNSTNFSSGFFNSVEQPLYVFNKPLEMSRECFLNSEGLLVLRKHFENSWWIFSQNMTDEEKSNHPEHITIRLIKEKGEYKNA